MELLNSENQSERDVKIRMTPERALLSRGPADKVAENIATEQNRLQTQPKNRLTAREMESITALCDTFVPSIKASLECSISTQAFYETSASMVGTPEILGGYLSEKLRHPLLWLLRTALWLLSTWYGTFILCGIKSLSGNFPYFQRFSQVEVKHREEIVLNWSLSYFTILRMLFRAMKFLVHLIYFTQLDESNQNHAWKALDYCGPDPGHADEITISNSQSDADRLGPLYQALAYNLRPPQLLLPAKKSKPTTISCDVVVVGSGAGGGVVAGVLARAGYKVIVLEKGGYNARSNLSLLEGPSLDQMYEANGFLATDDMGMLILAGSTVGGGTAINWSASFRTPDHVISEWKNEHGLDLFGSEAYAEAMDIVCNRMGVETGKVPPECESLSTSVLRRGCRELGHKVNDIPCNAPRNHDCGWCCFGCRRGHKKGTQETWLVDLLESGNGVILTGCKAIRVAHEERGHRRRVATGVLCQYGHGSSDMTLFVESKMTVVACGAINTPVLLKRSGLKNPNIGKHLRLHPVVMAWGHFPNCEKKSYEGAILTAMAKVKSKDGYGAVIQTPSLHPGMFSALTPWVSSADFKFQMTRFSRTAHIFTLVRDRGSGTVDSSGYIRYRMDPRDELTLKKGIEKMIRIMEAAGAEEIGTQHCKGDKVRAKSVSSHDFEEFVKTVKGRDYRGLTTPICSAHQMGSCRMGKNEKTSVVDERGESWEVEGLYLADSSIVPTAIGVNPMVTIQSIAYCVSQSILQELRRKIPKQSKANV
ncbi:Long-chain-alcohol oxidase [Rhynchospora pubera]|uniref:Long-chain-alcohol oxidase n=1 Tax=Rhynchospora pubera TaxID=906938 RepID=A0AAV8BT34_9POAL|nr:Long-chain-alcohol oxidase [Rhynchospora pubera]